MDHEFSKRLRTASSANSSVENLSSTYGSRPPSTASSCWPSEGLGSPKKGSDKVYGDRFIPQRGSETDLATAFALKPAEHAPKGQKRKSEDKSGSDSLKTEVANRTFNALLKSELFGQDSTGNGIVNEFSADYAARVSTSSSGSPRRSLPRSHSAMLPPSSTVNSGSSSHAGPSGSAASHHHHHHHTSASASLPHSHSTGSLSSNPSTSNLLSFSSPNRKRAALAGGPQGADSPESSHYNLSPVSSTSQRLLLSPRKQIRSFSKVPFKVLDAPDLADDFYLNLVDWSQSNLLGVGLGSCVYLWSASTSKVTKLCDHASRSDVITSVAWEQKGPHLAVGCNSGTVEIWDAQANKLLRTIRGHSSRVGAMAWNGHVLTTGSRDRTIVHRDVRAPEPSFRTLTSHKQEVCGLKYAPDGSQLASGGNDNKLMVWQGTESTPVWRFAEHNAAVKAIAWNPHQSGILASGGGTADKKIRFWNTITGKCLSEVDTGSQICNLLFSPTSAELVSTHGFSSGPAQNHVCVWKYPSMQQAATLTGHSMRVLYLAASPDGRTIVTGAGDDTLRFWDCFKPAPKSISTVRSLLDPIASIR